MGNVKHTHEQCQKCVSGIKELAEQLKRMASEDTSKHVCDTILDICDQLLREPKK
jgi:hypothetical protein